MNIEEKISHENQRRAQVFYELLLKQKRPSARAGHVRSFAIKCDEYSALFLLQLVGKDKSPEVVKAAIDQLWMLSFKYPLALVVKNGHYLLEYFGEMYESGEGLLPLRKEEQQLVPKKVPREEQPDSSQVIHVGEVASAREELNELQAQVVGRFQELLDSLAGRRGASAEDNKRIAEEVYDAARRSGIQLLYNDQSAYFYWASGVFQMRSTDSSRTPLGPTSAEFPELTAHGKQSGKESGESVSKDDVGFAGKIKDGTKRKR
jgi:hypothetical protein